jgi:signal transduction histidine kinase/ActR/RegA family two-component response regulator
MAKSKLAIAVASKFGRLFGSNDGEQASAPAADSLARALTAASPDTIVIIDNEGRILSSIVRLGGAAKASFADKFAPGGSFFDLQGSRIENLKQAVAEADAGDSCRVSEFSLSDNEGGVIWVEARISRIDAERILVLCQDITIRRSSGLERARLEDKINQMQKTESFGLLAGGLAHDYNNMLTAMLGNVDLILCDQSIEPGIRETVGDVRSAMLRASALVRRMLAYACKAEPVVEQTDVNAMVKDLTRLMKRSIPDNARLALATGENVPVIKIDSTQLWQIVMNLIVNACDALDGRQGNVRVTTLGMELSDDELASLNSGGEMKGGWYAVIEVEDTGIGMDDRTIQRIFDPFFTTKANGRGLGLASVISIVKSYGGGVGVRSHVGQGTTFRIVLPACLSASGRPIYPEEMARKSTAALAEAIMKGGASAGEAAASSSTAPAAESASASTAPAAESASASTAPAAQAPAPVQPATSATDNRKTLLVVDDDASILKLLKIILKSGGYNIVTATNGQEGVATYEKSPDLFSLALVDASMGVGMNGIEMCGEIRKTNKTIPLILMSAYRAKEMSTKMSAAGITGFLAKPFRGNDVLDLVAKYLKSANGTAAKGGDVGTVV